MHTIPHDHSQVLNQTTKDKITIAKDDCHDTLLGFCGGEESTLAHLLNDAVTRPPDA